jgi:hypothetical protein
MSPRMFALWWSHAHARVTQVAILTLLLIVGCSQKTALVPRGPHLPQREPPPVRVRSAAPLAQIEVVPLRRNKRCYYQDGYWSPDGGVWIWTKGQWILPPPGCYYAPPATHYEDLKVGTTLVYRPGTWHTLLPQRSLTCTEPQPCPAANAGE